MATRKKAAVKKRATKAKAKPKTKALAKRTTTELAPEDLVRDAGSGFEGMTSNDMAIPFLSIIQSGSPQLKKNHERYIRGATEGMVYNTVSNKCYDEVEVVPVHFRKLFVEWVPRSKGGGYVGQYERTDPIVRNAQRDEDGRLRSPEKNDLVETATYYVMVMDEDSGPYMAIIAMTSTQLGVSRRWNSVMQGRRATLSGGKTVPLAMFSHGYSLTTAEQSNEKGNWMGWVVDMEGRSLLEDPEAYAIARTMHSRAKDVGEVNIASTDDSEKTPDAF